jgi:hypothetical protein
MIAHCGLCVAMPRVDGAVVAGDPEAVTAAITPLGWRLIAGSWCCPACGARAIEAFAPSGQAAITAIVRRLRDEPGAAVRLGDPVVDLLCEAYGELAGEPGARIRDSIWTTPAAIRTVGGLR